MNVIFVVAVAGVSAGWVAHKLYHALFVVKQSDEDDIPDEQVVVKKEKTAKKETKKPKRKKLTPLKEKHVDDLSQLKGVGPKLVEALDEIGIYNYEELSSSSIDMLLTRLRETGGRFSRPAITAVVERAKLEAKER